MTDDNNEGWGGLTFRTYLTKEDAERAEYDLVTYWRANNIKGSCRVVPWGATWRLYQWSRGVV